MAARDAAKPADIPAIMPATVDKTLFAVDKFFIQAIGIVAPIIPPVPTITRDRVLRFLISSSDEFSITNFEF